MLSNTHLPHCGYKYFYRKNSIDSCNLSDCKIKNCYYCFPGTNTKCYACKIGYMLNKNYECVSSCIVPAMKNFYTDNNKCTQCKYD